MRVTPLAKSLNEGSHESLFVVLTYHQVSLAIQHVYASEMATKNCSFTYLHNYFIGVFPSLVTSLLWSSLNRMLSIQKGKE